MNIDTSHPSLLVNQLRSNFHYFDLLRMDLLDKLYNILRCQDVANCELSI